MKIKRYGEFVESISYIDLRKASLVSNINILEEDNNDVLIKVFNRIFNSDTVSKKDRKIVMELLSSSNMTMNQLLIQEGFFDKLKDRFPKAAEVSNLLKDKGEQILNGIIQKAKDAVGFVSKIIEGLKDLISKSFLSAKDFVAKQINKIKPKIVALNNKDKEGISKDLETGKSIVSWYRSDFIQSILSKSKESMTSFMSKEQDPIAESVINEGGNVIATLIHGIEKIPPFSWLHKVAKAGEAGANALIYAMSEFTKNIGGPAFELPVIAALIGILLEQVVKGDTSHWLIDIVGHGTGLYYAIKAIKYIALVVAVVVAIDEILSNTILGHGHDTQESGSEDETQEAKH